MAEELLIVGKSFPRKHDYEKLTGRARFACDIVLPGMLVGKVLGSPYAHAEVTSIDTSKAEALPGVLAVLSFKDKENETPCPLMLTKSAPAFTDHPRYYLDEIAAVAAVDEETARKAIELIDIQYKELPSYIDPLDAMDPNAYPIWPEGNVVKDGAIASQRGDVEKGFAESDYIIDCNYHLSAIHVMMLRDEVCVAWWESDDKLIIWVDNQMSWGGRDSLAAFYGLPTTNVIDVSSYTGNSMGMGHSAFYKITHIASLLARKARQPVRLAYSREETSTRYGIGRIDAYYTQRFGFNEDGSIMAQKTEHNSNAGAYGFGLSIRGHNDTYTCDNEITLMTAVATNKAASSSAYRGVGNVPGEMIVDTTMDAIAEKLNMDPLELKKKDFSRLYIGIPPGTKPPVPYPSCGIDECIEKGAEAFGWKAKWKGWNTPSSVQGTKKRGVGMAVMSYPCGGSSGGCSAIIEVEKDGSVKLNAGMNDCGQACDTTQAQVAAETIGVRFEDVRVTSGVTRDLPAGAMAGASKIMATAGLTVINAAKDVKNKLLQSASEVLETNVEDIEIKLGKIYVKGVETSTVKDLVTQIGAGGKDKFILGSGHSDPFPDTRHVHYFAAHFVEVEVDTETGHVDILKVVLAQDVGRAVNPAVVTQQLIGGFICATEMKLEDVVADKQTGIVLNSNYLDYKIPTIKDLDKADIEAILVEPLDPKGPYGAKGCSEGSLIPSAPAIIAAIRNAIGVRLDSWEATPDKILRALGKV